MNNRELAAALAGLRCLQERILNNTVPADILDIASGRGEFEPLDAEDIDTFCQDLNFGDCDGNPRVIVVVEGGVVQTIVADRPLNVDVLDHDNWKDIDRKADLEEWSRCDALRKEVDAGKLQQQIY